MEKITAEEKLTAEEKAQLILLFNEYILKNQLEIKLMYPCFIGRAGSGKSSRGLKIANKLKKSIRILILSQLLPEDIGGIPFVQKKQKQTVYTLPEWFNFDLIFVDELDKAKESKIAPILSILTERTLHSVPLSPSTQFIFAAQERENSFLDRIIEGDEVYDALARRLIFIPCFIEDSFEHIFQKYNISIKIKEDETSKKLRNFRMPLQHPPILEYIILFARWLITYFFQEDYESSILKAKNIIINIFYYIEGIENIVEAIFNSGICEEERISFFKRVIQNPKRFPLTLVSQALSTIPHLLSAKQFYQTLSYLYFNFSADERQRLFEELYKTLLETRELTTDDEFENSKWFIASWVALAKNLPPGEVFVKKEDIEKIYAVVCEYFPKEVAEIEKVLKEGGVENDKEN